MATVDTLDPSTTGHTANPDLPYPTDDAKLPDLAKYIQALAEQVAAAVPRALYATQATVALNNATQGNVYVPFPANRFSNPPRVCATMSSAPNGSQKFVARVYQAAAAGVYVYIYTGDQSVQTASVTVDVIAVEDA